MNRIPCARLSIALLVGVFALVPLVAAAAPPSSGGSTPTPSNPESRRIQRDIGGDATLAQRGMPPAYSISGRVVETSESPLAGVVIKLFANGILEDSITSDGDGSFSIETNPLTTGDGSWILWFESPDPEKFLDTDVVVQAGKVARERGLFPPCVAQVTTIGGNATVVVTMMTPDERREIVTGSNCLE